MPDNATPPVRPWKRRDFISLLASGALSLSFIPGRSGAKNSSPPAAALTVQQVIDLILKEIPGAPFAQTVDTLKSGRPDQPVTGIVTTMFATVPVIEQAVRRGANFIIAHEPTFYNHADATDWLQDNAVYAYKRGLLEKNNIAVWRFHDYWHTHRPDGVLTGVLEALGWQKASQPGSPNVVVLPSTPLNKLVTYIKEKLGIPQLRVIGDAAQPCRRLLLMPGAAGGRRQIEAAEKETPDVLICGEVAEWETAEYIRDAQRAGIRRALVVLGHAVSEEPGMQWLVPWLQPRVPGLPVHHIASTNPFRFV